MEFLWGAVIILAIISWILKTFVMPVATVVQTVSNNSFIKNYVDKNQLFDALHFITTIKVNEQMTRTNVIIAYNGIHFPISADSSFVIEREKIQYFVKEGDVAYTNQVYSTGKKISLGKAVVGGLIAGPLGAVIGGASGAEQIENATIVHDNTETYIYYFVNSDNVSIISVNGLEFYQALKMKFSEKEYNQVTTRIKIAKEHESISKCRDIEKFGEYPQNDITGKKKDKIEWYILQHDEKNHRKLLFSKYILDCMAYNENVDTISWEDSELRKWLNNDFFNNAFSKEEKEQIIEIETDKNVIDKVFCFNGEEYFNLFGINNDTIEPYESIAGTKGTIFAKNTNNHMLQVQNSYSDIDKWADGNSGYWLRSQVNEVVFGHMSKGIASPSGNGLLVAGGMCAYDDTVGVRPAIWIKEKSENTKKNIEDKPDLIMKYKRLLDDGIITKEEFEEQKKKILNSN